VPAHSLSIALLASLALACGAPSTPRPATPGATPVARDIAGATPLHGPFAGWDEICGAALAREEGDDGSSGVHHERCTVQESELPSGGAFLGMATYHEGSPYQGSSYLALRTARGWFVTEVPDGRPFGGGLSHHSPSSRSFDPATTRFEDGALRIVERGSASSFMPGQGPIGSSSRQWTSVTSCGLRDGVVVCAPPQEVYRETCQVTGELPDRTERACEEHGEDVPR